MEPSRAVSAPYTKVALSLYPGSITGLDIVGADTPNRTEDISLTRGKLCLLSYIGKLGEEVGYDPTQALNLTQISNLVHSPFLSLFQIGTPTRDSNPVNKLALRCSPLSLLWA